MSCKTCKSERIARVQGKVADGFYFNSKNPEIEYDGYVPENIGIGRKYGGDYIDFSYCLDCGQIQGKFPITDDALKYMESEEEDEDTDENEYTHYNDF